MVEGKEKRKQKKRGKAQNQEKGNNEGAEELYDLTSDPWQMKNVASDPKYAADLNRLRTRLTKRLKETNDPRQTGGAVLWDYYPYYGLRKNHNWKVDPMPSEPVKQ